MKGHVEYISRTEVKGWAVDVDMPARLLDVELLLDGVPVSVAQVRGGRPDLSVLNLGRIDLGFGLAVPDGASLDLERIAVRIAGTNQHLPISHDSPDSEGVIDHVSASSIGGWAWRAGRPSYRAHLSLLHRGRKIGGITADMPRPDLERAAIGDGRHGFIFDLSALPNFREIDPEEVEVIFEATGRSLHKAGRQSARPLISVEPATERAPSVSAEVLDALRSSLDLNDEPGKLDI